jgi:hypothetical protein
MQTPPANADQVLRNSRLLASPNIWFSTVNIQHLGSLSDAASPFSTSGALRPAGGVALVFGGANE